MGRPSFVVIALTASFSGLLVCAGVLLGPEPEEAPLVASAGPSQAPVVSAAHLPDGGGDVEAASEIRAAEVLHSWDRARARAYAGGDIEALARLYAPDSAAGQADLRLLHAYAARGLRVEGMRMQVLSLRVVSRHRHRWTLLVTDRLAGGVAVRGGDRWRLPRDRAGTSRIVLAWRSGRWRVRSVASLPVSAGSRTGR